jgi:hypothetical protein
MKNEPRQNEAGEPRGFARYGRARLRDVGLR